MTALAPYPTRDSRRPILAWTRQMPLGGEPVELIARIEAYDAWLATSESVPKLLMTFEGSPTLLIGKELADWCTTNIASLAGTKQTYSMPIRTAPADRGTRLPSATT